MDRLARELRVVELIHVRCNTGNDRISGRCFRLLSKFQLLRLSLLPRELLLFLLELIHGFDVRLRGDRAIVFQLLRLLVVHRLEFLFHLLPLHLQLAVILLLYLVHFLLMLVHRDLVGVVELRPQMRQLRLQLLIVRLIECMGLLFLLKSSPIGRKLHLLSTQSSLIDRFLVDIFLDITLNRV